MRLADLHPPVLWRTTAFRLTSIYGAVLVIGLAALLALIYAQTARLMSERVDRAIEAGLTELRHSDAEHLPARVQHDAAADVRRMNYFGLFSADGIWIAGNLDHWPTGVQVDGPARDIDTDRRRGVDMRVRAVRLPWGEQLVVGRDISQLAGVRAILLQAMLISGGLILGFGLIAGTILSRGPLSRLKALQYASLRITQGDLTARLPLSARRDELDLLAGAVNAMINEIERLVADAKSVGDTLAHDLRTPLTRLRALLYRVQEEVGPDDRHRAMIERAVEETDTLLARFRALLRISEIERQARRSGFQTVDLAALMRQAVELYEPLAEEQAVDLTLDELPPSGTDTEAEADPELLFEAICNLIDNAIKFTPAGGFVRLTLQPGPVIEVTDNGPGILASERELVMNRFHRGANAGALPGSGLGLAIVAAVAHLHGFIVELNDANPGLRATVRAPPLPR